MKTIEMTPRCVKRIAILEHKLWAGSEPPRTHTESKPGQSVWWV